MKKLTEKYVFDDDILNCAIIGFEVEFYSEKSYYKLLEYFNRELSPIKVSGYRQYHSSFKPTQTHWKIEPDLSMGYDGIELVTGPLNYSDARIYAAKILKMLQNKNFHTDDLCSFQINISFDKNKTEKTIDKINKLKLILDIDENYIYNLFPKRKNNQYCRSVKRLIPFKNIDMVNLNSIKILENSLILPHTKYFGINFSNIYTDRIEYRYIGSENYQYNINEILELLDYFILLTWNSINEELTEDNIQELIEIVSSNLNIFKTYNNIDNFISNFPSIKLLVNKNENIFYIKNYYNSFYEKLYDLISNTQNLKECVINYNTNTKRLEIVDANIKLIFNIKDVDFIDCYIYNGEIEDCNVIDCELLNMHINTSKIYSSSINNSKIIKCDITDNCTIENCYMLFNNISNSSINSGVLRNCSVSNDCTIGDDVRIYKDDNYFNILDMTQININDDKKSFNDKKIKKK